MARSSTNVSRSSHRPAALKVGDSLLFLEPCSRQAVHWKRALFVHPLPPAGHQPPKPRSTIPETTFGMSRLWKEGGIETNLLLVLPIRSHLLALRIPSSFRLCHRCRLIFLWLPQAWQLITQRSVVQIHPPQPNSSSTYERSTSSALSISPKISPNRHQDRTSKGERLSADLAKIKEAPAGLRVSNSAHRDQLCLARAISALSGTGFSARSTALRGADKVDSVDYTSAQIKQLLLTETEAAKRVGVSLSTFRRWRHKGVGPKFFLLGGILRPRIVDLDEFVACHVRRGGA
jgi:hypothetical protein